MSDLGRQSAAEDCICLENYINFSLQTSLAQFWREILPATRLSSKQRRESEMPDTSDDKSARQDELTHLARQEASLLSALLTSQRQSETLRRSLLIALGLHDVAEPAASAAEPAAEPAPNRPPPLLETDPAPAAEHVETSLRGPWPLERWSAHNVSEGPHALVVDDVPMVRDHTQRLLERLGYKVVGAENGPMALRVASSLPRLDLLVTDVVMPLAMNGRELADKLTERFPESKVVFVSGFADLGVDERVGLPPSAPLLAKPFTRVEFNEAIQRAVGAPPSNAAPVPH